MDIGFSVFLAFYLAGSPVLVLQDQREFDTRESCNKAIASILKGGERYFKPVFKQPVQGDVPAGASLSRKFFCDKLASQEDENRLFSSAQTGK